MTLYTTDPRPTENTSDQPGSALDFALDNVEGTHLIAETLASEIDGLQGVDEAADYNWTGSHDFAADVGINAALNITGGISATADIYCGGTISGSIDAGNIDSGTLAEARLPDLSSSYATAGHTHTGQGISPDNVIVALASSDIYIGTIANGISIVTGLGEEKFNVNDVGVVSASSFTGSIDASNIDSGTLAPERVGSGLPDTTTYLRGDGSWLTHQLSAMEDVASATATNRNVLVANGLAWQSRALQAADLPDLSATYATSTHTHTLSQITDAGDAASRTVGSSQNQLLAHDANNRVTISQVRCNELREPGNSLLLAKSGNDTVAQVARSGGKIGWRSFASTTIGTLDDSGELELHITGKGIVMRSPDGTRYRLTIDNGGTVSVAAA